MKDYIVGKVKDKIKHRIYKSLKIPNVSSIVLVKLGVAKISVKYLIILTILSFL